MRKVDDEFEDVEVLIVEKGETISNDDDRLEKSVDKDEEDLPVQGLCQFLRDLLRFEREDQIEVL